MHPYSRLDALPLASMSQTQSCLFKIKENEEHARRNRILPEDRKYVPELDYLGKLPL